MLIWPELEGNSCATTIIRAALSAMLNPPLARCAQTWGLSICKMTCPRPQYQAHNPPRRHLCCRVGDLRDRQPIFALCNDAASRDKRCWHMSSWRGYCSMSCWGWGIRGRAGQTTMKQMLLTRNVCEPDLDITRVTAGPSSGGRLRRLFRSIFRNSQPHYYIEAPRRSVDREQQQYSPDYD